MFFLQVKPTEVAAVKVLVPGALHFDRLRVDNKVVGSIRLWVFFHKGDDGDAPGGTLGHKLCHAVFAVLVAEDNQSICTVDLPHFYRFVKERQMAFKDHAIIRHLCIFGPRAVVEKLFHRLAPSDGMALIEFVANVQRMEGVLGAVKLFHDNG